MEAELGSLKKYVTELENYCISLDSIVRKHHLILYADDTVLYNSHPDVNVSLLQLQHDLDLLSNWLQYNKLTINIRKSKFMIIGSTSMLQRISADSLLKLTIRNECLDRVESYDYLGITLDPTLTWIRLLI